MYNNLPKIKKSSRHQKIIGQFGEQLICNWLSRSGFEVSLVDHVGIDIVAYNPNANKRIGITVKSRTRNEGKENDSVNILSNREKYNDREKIKKACDVFTCKPWIAVYVETLSYADVYLTSLKNYDKKYRGNKNRAVDVWSMHHEIIDKYDEDTEVIHLRIKFAANNWNFS